MSRRIFVTGIGTEVGKTIVSAILVEALRADYWKPVQSGSLERTDAEVVQSLISCGESRFHPASYLLCEPIAPERAARLEGKEISPQRLVPPKTSGPLVIEGCGGVLVPLAPGYTVLDLIIELKAEVVLVSRTYLGSINHTLLSLAALKQRGISPLGVIYNGPRDDYTEEVVLRESGVGSLGHVPEGNPSKRWVADLAAIFREVV